MAWGSGDAFGAKPTLIDKGDGTSSMEVRANFKPEDLGALGVTSLDEEAYCDVFRHASRRLWTVTNGQHYFESVTFDYGALETDVFVTKGPRSLANGNRILLQFQTPAKGSGENMGQVLAHEWGHYFYDLPDEYSEAKDLGFCANWGKSLSKDASCSGFPTSSCAGGARCIRHRSCINDGGDYDGFYLVDGDPWTPAMVDAWGVVSASQCAAAGGSGPHAVCVLYDPLGTISFPFGGHEAWPNWGAQCLNDYNCDTGFGSGEGRCTAGISGDGWTRAICEGGTSCIMSAHAGKAHWCDANSHVHFDDDGVSLSHNHSLLGRAHANPNMHAPEDYNCWDQAKSVWGGLQFNGQYNDDLELPPNDGDPNFCTWNVPDYTDIEALFDWSMIVIDASGSMIKATNGAPGWVYAVDGAEYFNQVAVDKGRKAGIYGFGDDLWPMQWAEVINHQIQAPQPGTQEMVLGEPIDLKLKAVKLYRAGVGAYVGENNGTNLCAVLEGAKHAFAHAGAPAGDREVVLLTDARFSVTSKAGDCRGVPRWVVDDPSIASQICAEAGMRVNVITTGAEPNMELAQWLADSCGGWHFYAGDEQGAGGSLAHAAKVYAAMSKALVAGDAVALQERAPLAAASDTESHQFAVPAGAAALEVGWLGGPFVVTAAGTTPAFNSLGFVLESPGGMVSNPANNDSELEAIYRRITIDAPEPGVWTMRVDASQVPADARPQIEVGWLASFDHAGYAADAWVARPVWTIGEEVTILGSVDHGEYGIGAAQVAARISGLGQSWTVPMFDNGQHDNGIPNDGVYGARFVPTVPGAHAVKVDYDVLPGISHTIPGEPIFGSGPGAELVSDSASLVAHTAFEVRTEPVGLLHAALPSLQAGETHENLSATIKGRLVPWPGVSVSLGEGVVVQDLEVRCVNCTAVSDDIDPAALVYELRFSAKVSPDAPLTERDLLVEIGAADYRLERGTRVAAAADRGNRASCEVQDFNRFGAAFGLAVLMVLGLGLRLRAVKTR